MTRQTRIAALFILLTTYLPFAAPALAEEPQWVAASAGQYDVFNKGNGVEVGWELRFAPRRLPFLPDFVPELAPIGGALATSRGSLYAYGGFRFDIPLDQRWTLSPSAAGGFSAPPSITCIGYSTPRGPFSVNSPTTSQNSNPLSTRKPNSAT